MSFNHHEIIVLPPKFIPELVSLPEQKASFNRELFVRLLGKYTTIGVGGGSFTHIAPLVRIDLGRHLEAILPLLQEEIGLAVSRRIGSPDE